jgi:hypothetical protein
LRRPDPVQPIEICDERHRVGPIEMRDKRGPGRL